MSAHTRREYSFFVTLVLRIAFVYRNISSQGKIFFALPQCLLFLNLSSRLERKSISKLRFLKLSLS